MIIVSKNDNDFNDKTLINFQEVVNKNDHNLQPYKDNAKK